MNRSHLWNTIPALCRSDKGVVEHWLTMGTRSSMREILPLLIISTSLYGFSLGAWHGLEMSCFIAIKFPLAIIVTLGFTALLNGILTALTNSGISIRQSLQFQLTGFAIFGIILASLSPLVFFLSLTSPAPMAEGMAQSYRIYLTANVLVIAFAGVFSQSILLSYLKGFAKNKTAAIKTFILWLTVNLLVGAEVTHSLRPFFGAPRLEVEFLREDMLDRNFYESVYHVLRFIT